MSIIIYGIIDSRQIDDTLSDVVNMLSVEFDLDFNLISHDKLSAIISTEKEKTNKTTTTVISRDDVLLYAGIVDKISRYYSVLPMRYGSVVSSYIDVQTLLKNNAISFLQVLNKILNKEEYSIKVLFSQQNQGNENKEDEVEQFKSAPDTLKGNSINQHYLLKKYRMHKIDENRRLYIEKVQSLFLFDTKKITEFVNIKKILSPGFIIDAVLLIAKSSRPQLLSLVTHMQYLYPQHNVILTGPWPAYYFAQINIE